jgi:hypothetical protein
MLGQCPLSPLAVAAVVVRPQAFNAHARLTPVKLQLFSRRMLHSVMVLLRLRVWVQCQASEWEMC